MTEPQQWHPILATSAGYQAAEKERDRIRDLRDQALERDQRESEAYLDALAAYRAEANRQMAQGILPSDPEPSPPRGNAALTQQLTRDLAQADEVLRRSSFDAEALVAALRERERELQEFVTQFVEPLRAVQTELAQLNRTAAHAVAVDGGHLRVNPPASLAALVTWAESGVSLVDAPDEFDVESASFEENRRPARMDLDRAFHGTRDAWSGRR